MNALKIVGLLAVASIAVAVAWNYGDLRRYIKIEMM
jgi:hypothetical protein